MHGKIYIFPADSDRSANKLHRKDAARSVEESDGKECGG